MKRNNNGTFAKGNKGRPKGSLNKSTTEIKRFLIDFLNENKDTIQSDFENLHPSERLRFFLDVVKFIVPKPIDENPEPTEIKPITIQLLKDDSDTV